MSCKDTISLRSCTYFDRQRASPICPVLRTVSSSRGFPFGLAFVSVLQQNMRKYVQQVNNSLRSLTVKSDGFLVITDRKGKVTFTQVFVCPCYGAVGTHPTGMLSCFKKRCSSKKIRRYKLCRIYYLMYKCLRSIAVNQSMRSIALSSCCCFVDL